MKFRHCFHPSRYRTWRSHINIARANAVTGRVSWTCATLRCFRRPSMILRRQKPHPHHSFINQAMILWIIADAPWFVRNTFRSPNSKHFANARSTNQLIRSNHAIPLVNARRHCIPPWSSFREARVGWPLRRQDQG